MTNKEHQIIRNLIIKTDTKEMEFYEELYDHIVSSFKSRRDESQSIKDHLNEEVIPSFGGILGLQKMIKKQRKIGKKQVYSAVLNELSSFFNSFQGFLKTLIILLGIYTLRLLFGDSVIQDLVTIALIIPFLSISIARWIFKKRCKKQGLPYESSYSNQTVFIICSSVIAIVQGLPDIIHRIVYGSRFSIIEYGFQFEALIIPISFIIAIYLWVSIYLITNKVKLKLNPQI